MCDLDEETRRLGAGGGFVEMHMYLTHINGSTGRIGKYWNKNQIGTDRLGNIVHYSHISTDRLGIFKRQKGAFRRDMEAIFISTSQFMRALASPWGLGRLV